ncbi:uncharacterized protein LOC120432483 [Culex pipiens pallens]|uniref:uncharacterized protein LOC120432483 n=1 Tax=Culex pipiens pallens TaxID=42434 RepID=UPI001952A112|nr:uncharacterized protein LOC120432483 [Culex pipiens pallens]
MTQKVLQTITIPALEPTQHLFQSFKIMPVAQNSRAYVNAGFLIKFRKEHVLVPERVTICFGGINPVFVHATETENYLIGRPLFTNETIQNALQLLSTELEPNPSLSEASPIYCKQLALSLFYKFILATAPQHTMIVNPRFKSGGLILERALSSGKQSYDTYPSKWPLTQNVPKIEALAQTSGEAEYINDMPDRPNELHAAFVLATEVQSRIAKIDATEAMKVKGVVGFYSAKNIPGCNNFMPAELGYPEVEEIFCSGEVGYHGQPVGMVLAESFELANRAAALVDICYERTSRRPVYPTVMDILDGGAYDRVVNQNFDRHGALFAVAREGPIKVKGRHDLHGQYHYTMETQTCFCEPIEDGMNVYSSTQSPNLIHVAVSQALGVSANSLNVVVRRAGGAYGAKFSRSAQIACACAVAAQLTKRPVRMVLSMETNMAAIGKRHDLRNEYEVDVDENGKINRLSSTYTHGNGASLNEQLAFLTSDLFKNCYQTDRWNLVGNSARTHVPSNTFCRAPGTLDGIAMIENIMEHIAQAVGRDPLEVRLLNISKENKMYTLLPQFRKDVDFDVRRQAIDVFNRQNRWRKRGIAIIPMEYPLEYFGTTNALVSVYYSDGTVAITHGAIEMGQGVNTKVAQVASHVLGISLDKISVKPTATLTSPNVRPSVHSQASETAAFAVQKCCEILRERFRPLREQYPSATWEQLVAQAYAANLDLTATHHYQPRQLQAYVVWGAACAELEVDILTGNVQVSRVDILEDVGESMSPGIDIGQVEGSFIMGLGHYLTEALIYNPTNGALVNNRSWNYKVPGAKDIPVDFRVRFLKGSSNPSGVLRAKTAGEPAVSMSPVLTYALRYALRSARKDAGLPDEWIPLGTANTPEKIFLLAGNRTDQYKLH